MTILSPIEHIVVVMLENRSLDNMLGGLYPSGSAPSAVLPAGTASSFDGFEHRPLESCGRSLFHRGISGARSGGAVGRATRRCPIRIRKRLSPTSPINCTDLEELPWIPAGRCKASW